VSLFPPPQRQIIGKVSSNGDVVLTREWYLYLAQGLFERTGGYDASSNVELARQIETLEAEVDSNILGLAPVAQPFEQATNESGRIELLEAMLAEVSKQIQDLKQGTTL
jgi:hypothetical protein